MDISKLILYSLSGNKVICNYKHHLDNVCTHSIGSVR